MAKFIYGNDLNSEIGRIFSTANKYLLIISPYIKLHEHYASILLEKRNIPELRVVLVFGKNEEDKSKSLSSVDLEFFKSFSNIEIRYEKDLHAKYYANEDFAIITSLNLHKYSHENNIEVGVKTNTKGFFRELTDDILPSFFNQEDLEYESYNYFQDVIENSELVFKKEPIFESSLFGLNKNYIKSEIIEDKSATFLKDNNDKIIFVKKYETSIPSKEIKKVGYCIRTGAEIPFNQNRPFSEAAFLSWNKYKDKEYLEKFCHFSGEKSNGETTFSKPILRKNWNKAKEIHKF